MRGLLRDVMSRDLLTVAPEDTLGEAAEKMAGGGVGAALVMDFGRLVGILTERDLLAAVASRVHTSEARVREWMTENPVTVPEATPIERAASVMVTRGFRHLPIVDGSGPSGSSASATSSARLSANTRSTRTRTRRSRRGRSTPTPRPANGLL
jgi:CBS domain-containing protein